MGVRSWAARNFHDEDSLLSLALEMCIEDEDLLLQEVLEIFDADLPILVSVCRWNQIATARPCSETMQPTTKESTWC